MIRSSTRHNEHIQNLLTKIFDATDSTDIQTLRKYVFVPMNLSGDDSRTTMQGIVRTQQNFRKTVHHYIVTNVSNLCTAYAITPPTDNQQMETDEPAEESKQADQENSDTTTTTENQTQDQDPPTEMYTLREWFYDLMDDQNEPLIHSVYPSADANKIFVLCEKQKAIKVLELLHNLIEAISQDFPATAIAEIFGTNRDMPLVHNYPRASSQLSRYAASLSAHAMAPNPQEEQPNVQHNQDTNRKRNRQGDPTASNYAKAAASASQAQQVNYGANVGSLLQKLNVNQQNLTKIELQQQQYEQRFLNIETGLKGHGELLTKLSTTQIQQGSVLTNLQSKMDNLISYITKPDQQQEEQQNTNTTETITPNTSQGGQEGTQP